MTRTETMQLSRDKNIVMRRVDEIADAQERAVEERDTAPHEAEIVEVVPVDAVEAPPPIPSRALKRVAQTFAVISALATIVVAGMLFRVAFIDAQANESVVGSTAAIDAPFYLTITSQDSEGEVFVGGASLGMVPIVTAVSCIDGQVTVERHYRGKVTSKAVTCVKNGAARVTLPSMSRAKSR